MSLVCASAISISLGPPDSISTAVAGDTDVADTSRASTRARTDIARIYLVTGVSVFDLAGTATAITTGEVAIVAAFATLESTISANVR